MNYKFLLHLVIIFSIASIGYSQEKTIRLTKNWEYLKGDLGGIWEAIRFTKKGSPQDVPIWENVTLPHCVNSYDAVDPDVNYYQGPAWYRTNIEVNNPYGIDGRTLLHFEGAGQKTEVYIYTEKVGEHIGGYDEWTVDITDAIIRFLANEDADRFQGKIPLSIKTDNSRDLEMIPSDLSDFNLYGGLYRYVNLSYVPQNYLQTLQLKPVLAENGKKATLEVSGIIKAHQQNDMAKVEIKLFDPSGKELNCVKVDVETYGTFNDFTTFDLKKPVLWTPNDPNLYTCKINLTYKDFQQEITQKTGFRNFTFKEKGPFLLNGERLLLRGTHRHEDHAGVGAAMTEDMMRKEMLMMKQMGVNFIRLGHYQQSSIILDLCDSLGILVWEEIPWCRGGLGGDQYKEQARSMLTNMITQHRNHASVIIWGLGNENDWPGDFSGFDKKKIRGFMKELNDLAHQLDPSRKTAIRRCDFCKDIVDVYSPSIWAGWYRGKFTDYKAVSKKEMETVNHFLHVEWGASNHARRHSEDPDKGITGIKSGITADERAGDASLYGGEARVSKDGDWTETYACNLIDWHLKEQEDMDWLTGTAYWPFKDFSTPVRPENPVPYVNQKGVVERDFTKKEAYYVFQSYWTEKLMARIYSHSWKNRWGEKDEKKLVKVYSNGKEAELFVNGKSVGKKNRDSQDFPAAGLRWKINFKEGENHLKVIAYKNGKQVTDETTLYYQTKKWNNPEKLILNKIAYNLDTTWLEVNALDADGTLCLDAKNVVRFECSGDGHLIKNMGTSTASSKVQLYNGRAAIALVNNGTSNVAVKSDNLETGFITIKDNDDDFYTKALERAVAHYSKVLDDKPEKGAIPRALNHDGSLHKVPSADWTSGFYPGVLWYLYEYSDNPAFRKAAESWTALIEDQKYNGRTHDMGFKVYCSFGNGFRLTNNSSYKDIIIQSSNTLITRFKPKAGIIRSWDHNTDKWDCPVIIDNMMNLELLFNTTKFTDDSTFYNIAISHADRTLENHFRKDFSTYHVLDYDTLTGEVTKKHTHQGYAHESSWTRGQAWGLYGYTMSYRESNDAKYLERANEIANYIMTHPNMPKDLVPYWDFDAPEIPNEPRDVSAAAIMASALLELSEYVDGDLKRYYFKTGKEILKVLSSEKYFTKPHRYFLLEQSTGSKPANSEVNVPLIYAEYYYIEALLRYKKIIDKT